MPKSVRTAATDVPSAASVLDRPAMLAEEEIAELAYSFWEARGFQGGSPEEDWLRAEQELIRVGELNQD